MDKILEELLELKKLIQENNLLSKEVLNFSETCRYLDISASHLYKLTSSKQIPHFCPQGKRLYFSRAELDDWLKRNRSQPQSEVDSEATDYLLKKGRSL